MSRGMLQPAVPMVVDMSRERSAASSQGPLPVDPFAQTRSYRRARIVLNARSCTNRAADWHIARQRQAHPVERTRTSTYDVLVPFKTVAQAERLSATAPPTTMIDVSLNPHVRRTCDVRHGSFLRFARQAAGFRAPETKLPDGCVMSLAPGGGEASSAFKLATVRSARWRW